MRFFSVGQLSNSGPERNEIWHKGSLGDEDDTRTSPQPYKRQSARMSEMKKKLGPDGTEHL